MIGLTVLELVQGFGACFRGGRTEVRVGLADVWRLMATNPSCSGQFKEPH